MGTRTRSPPVSGPHFRDKRKYIKESMGKRFFDFCKKGPQIFQKCAIDSSFGFLEPFLGEKWKKKNWPPKKILDPPPRENRLKNNKNSQKWPFLDPKWLVKGEQLCIFTFFWCRNQNLIKPIWFFGIKYNFLR